MQIVCFCLGVRSGTRQEVCQRQEERDDHECYQQGRTSHQIMLLTTNPSKSLESLCRTHISPKARDKTKCVPIEENYAKPLITDGTARFLLESVCLTEHGASCSVNKNGHRRPVKR